jgi:hypothetical protein
LLVTLATAALLMPGSVSAQSGPPPGLHPPICPLPAGITVVEATYPAVAPAGIPAVVGPGALAVIPPAGGGALGVVTAEVGGCQASVFVPADPNISLAVRLQGAVPTGQVPQPAPDPVSQAACRFSVNVYNAATGQPVASGLSSEVVSALVPASGAGTMVLTYYNPDASAWKTVTESLGAADAIHEGQIGGLLCCALRDPTPTALPSALPNTGGGQPVVTWPFALVLLGAALYAGSGAWRRSSGPAAK